MVPVGVRHGPYVTAHRRLPSQVALGPGQSQECGPAVQVAAETRTHAQTLCKFLTQSAS